METINTSILIQDINLKSLILQTFFTVVCVLFLFSCFAGIILPRFLKSNKNILLRMKNRLLGEFEYHQKDKDTP